MTDNLELIKPLLKFDTPDDFYYLQILQRKKENAELGSNSRVIKNYYIKSVEYLELRYDEIKKLCDVFNARAMIRLNKRSFEKVGFKCMQNLANTMMNKEYSFLKASYDRACGLGHNDPNKTWILDVDDNDKDTFDWLYNLNDHIKELEPNIGTDKTICKIPSKNGFHIITHPFNKKDFKDEYPDVEILTDNPTNLYIS